MESEFVYDDDLYTLCGYRSMPLIDYLPAMTFQLIDSHTEGHIRSTMIEQNNKLVDEFHKDFEIG